MPVRLLNSSVFEWPDALTVDQAVRGWAMAAGETRPEVWRIGYFGSYARGNWGVGSDVDLIVIVDRAIPPFEKRALDWDVLDLPVPADVLVYSRSEWEAMARENGRFYRMIAADAVWVYERSA